MNTVNQRVMSEFLTKRPPNESCYKVVTHQNLYAADT